MSWSAEQQTEAEAGAARFAAEFREKMEAWTSAVRSGAPTASTSKAAVEDVVRRWRQHLGGLQTQSDIIFGNGTAMDELGQLATQVAEEKEVLQRLRSEAGTRSRQVDSLNPKARPSPYTNILGLNRIFRDSTRNGILIASIVFGALSLSALGFLVYNVVTTVQVGGRRNR
jgi:hypothetical protein